MGICTIITGLLKKSSGYIIIAIILFAAIWKYGNYRENMGREEIERQIRENPIITSDTASTTTFTEQPLQDLQDIAAAKPKPVIIYREVPAGVDEQTIVYIRQLEEWASDLKQEQSTTLKDSLGGTHELTYEPPTKMFSELYRPPPKEEVSTTITNTKIIFDERNWTAGLYVEKTGDIGLGATLGRKPLYVGITYFDNADKKWGYKIGVMFEF